MKNKIRLILIVVSLSVLNGCVAYTPYPEYSAPAYYGGPRYYGGYGYSVTPAVPVPMFYGGWGYRGHWHHGHH